jgi:digeranylgeranylglycerophospholipid reductase
LKSTLIHDVVVIGAGPVGCYSAAQMAQLGFEVLVVERETFPKTAPVCTGIIGVEAFQRFGLSRKSILTAIKDISLYSPTGKEIAYQPAETQAYAVDRTIFDDELRQKAQNSGAVFLHGITCKDFSVQSDCVEVSLTPPMAPIKAKTLILASGYSPGLVSKLGIERIGQYFEGIQVEATVEGLTKTEIYVGQATAPSSFAWVIPIGLSRARIGLTTPRNGAHFLNLFLENELIKNRVNDTTSPARKLIPFGQLKRSFCDRVLIVGEAAGQVKSTTHGGVYYGLIGADCAVETLKEAFDQDSFDMSFFCRYEQKWRSQIGKEIDRGFMLRKIFNKLTDKHIEKLFDLSTKDGIMRIVNEKARFDWHNIVISALFEHPLLSRFFKEA